MTFDPVAYAEEREKAQKEVDEAAKELVTPPVEITESQWSTAWERRGQEDAKRLFDAMGMDGKGKITIVPDPAPAAEEAPEETNEK